MDPNSGRYMSVSDVEWNNLPSEEREKFSVQMDGPEEDVQRISEAVAGYRQAEEVLKELRAYAKKVARSGNPGRASVGKDILSLLEPQK